MWLSSIARKRALNEWMHKHEPRHKLSKCLMSRKLNTSRTISSRTVYAASTLNDRRLIRRAKECA